MSGLLDFLDTDEGRLGLGLLAAAGPRSDGMGFGGRMQEAFAGADARKRAKAEAEMRQMQMEEQRAMMAQRQQAAAREQQMQAAYARAQTPGQPGLSPLMADPSAGILASQGRAAVPAGFNAQQFANEAGGIDWKEGMRLQQAMQKDDTPIKLSPGETMFSGKAGGYKPLVSLPGKEASLPAAVQEYQFAKGQGFSGSFLDFATQQKRAGASSVSVSMTDGQKGFENEMKLKGAFSQEPIYKAHQEVKSAFDQVNAALTAGTPVGDLAGATKIMKILDPGSVVRESELGMAMAAGGRIDRLQNYVKQAMDGTKLTPQQRTDFGNLASELTAASAQTYNSKRNEYRSQGADYGLNSDRALGKPVDVPSITKPTKSSGLSITAPNGKTYTFNSQAELNNFKMATGVK